MKNMKKLLCILLALSMVLALCACGSSTEEAATEEAPAEEATEAPAEEAPAEEEVDYSTMTIDELKPLLTTVTEGKLTVATSPDFAPYEFYAIDENGEPQLAGFDVSLAGYIADYLGLELEIVPMDFDGTIAELASGKADLGMAGYSPTPERLEVMDFSMVYITGGQSFVCLQENKDLFTSLEDTNKAEYSIGAQVGSIQVGLAQENSPEADLVELSKVPDIIAEVLNGKLDGAYIETMVAESYAKNYPELCLVLPVPYDAEGSVVGITKGNAPLVAAVNLAIQACLDSGEFDTYVYEANELAAGDIIEGLVD